MQHDLLTAGNFKEIDDLFPIRRCQRLRLLGLLKSFDVASEDHRVFGDVGFDFVAREHSINLLAKSAQLSLHEHVDALAAILIVPDDHLRAARLARG